uniref:ferrous iron transport protein A n=1 Tax=Brevibacterium renqingii TaxID=2776916 RepID=UPI001ADF8DBB
TSDPHGDPIPGPDGRVDSHTPTLLAAAASGHYEVLRVSDADPLVLGRLAEAGVLPDAELDVLARSEEHVTVAIGGVQETIEAALAAAVYLRVTASDEA